MLPSTQAVHGKSRAQTHVAHQGLGDILGEAGRGRGRDGSARCRRASGCGSACGWRRLQSLQFGVDVDVPVPASVMVADEVGGRPRARRGHSRWHGSARTSFDGVLELQGLSCKTSSRWWVAAAWLAHTNEHVVCSVGESLQLAVLQDRPARDGHDTKAGIREKR
jgi:hypothetical protein